MADDPRKQSTVTRFQVPDWESSGQYKDLEDNRPSEAETWRLQQPSPEELQAKKEIRDSHTIPQLKGLADELRGKIQRGELAEGNVEMAALLGFKPAQMAMGNRPGPGMSPGELIRFLLEDPNLRITIDVSAPGGGE